MIGAPWINANRLADELNRQGLPGVTFFPFHYRPFYGSLKGTDCHGVLIRITNHTIYQPFKVQCLLLGILKTLYPEKIKSAFKEADAYKKIFFCKAMGNDEVWNILLREPYTAWKMIACHKERRKEFAKVRVKYLIAEYALSPH